jgi:hypothetical protein
MGRAGHHADARSAAPTTLSRIGDEVVPWLEGENPAPDIAERGRRTIAVVLSEES